jgi:hypothetical protein
LNLISQASSSNTMMRYGANGSNPMVSGRFWSVPKAIGAVLLAALVCCASCTTLKDLPPVDLSAPGWVVHSGQAVWLPGGGRAEITGDLVFATNNTGDCFVQLLKTPFPIVTAQNVAGAWQIEFGANEHHWQGKGNPPGRFVWFHLPAALAGAPLPPNWRLEKTSAASFKLQNTSTGESLEGQFFP